MTHRIGVIAGDGAGTEVVAEARKVVDALALDLSWYELPWGTDHYHRHGAMMPPDALDTVRSYDAVLLGAVGDPSVPDHVTLWGLLLPLRPGPRPLGEPPPARLLDGVPSKLEGRPAVDMLFVRENTEGEYSGVGGRAHQGLSSRSASRRASSRAPASARDRVCLRARREAAWSRSPARRSRTRRATATCSGTRSRRKSPRSTRSHARARARRRARRAHGERPCEPRRRRRVEPLRRRAHRHRRGAAGRHGHGGEREHRAGLGHAAGVRAGARLRAGHRGQGDREPDRRDLERRAHARAPRRGRRRAASDAARSRRCAAKARARATSAATRRRPRSATRSRAGGRMAEWWRDAVFYEIYVRSFADSNGDGVGDLAGIRSRLPYLRDLGIDAIWLTPFYPSPGADHGYDVSTTSTSIRSSARSPTSTSSSRARTSSASASSPTSSRTTRSTSIPGSRGDRSRYITAPAADGPPNNWPSNWGGPAWTLDESRASTTSTCSHRSSPTSTGTTTRCGTTSTRSSASGSTAASTASASTSPTVS